MGRRMEDKSSAGPMLQSIPHTGIPSNAPNVLCSGEGQPAASAAPHRVSRTGKAAGSAHVDGSSLSDNALRSKYLRRNSRTVMAVTNCYLGLHPLLLSWAAPPL